MRFYYINSLAFYLAMTLMHVIEARGKDFYAMLTHHIVVTFLILYATAANFHRVFAVGQFIHDGPDAFLEATRSLRYAKCRRASAITFIMFTISCLLVRIVIYPQLVYVTLVYMPYYPGYFLNNGLFLTIMVLHVFWTYLLFKVIYKLLVTKEISSDQSDSDDGEISDESSNEVEKIKI